MKKTLGGWLALMAFALALLPWHQQEAGFFAGRWMSADWTAKKDAASALYLMLKHGAGVLWPLVGLGVVALGALFAPLPRALRGLLMLGCGAGGLAWLLVLGFAPEWLGLGKQVGLGYGAMLVAAAFLFLLTGGAALLGACRGDMFVTGMIGLIIALISLFVIMPVGHVLAKAFVDPQGS